MKHRHRRIDQQVMVITGASSGIGLATARLAAERGATVVLLARNGEALEAATEDLRSNGHAASHVVADVADRAALERAARTAVERHGRLDTWVNNAGVSIYGKLEDVPEEDHRRLFETNFWGVVNGSLVAVEHLRRNGGVIVNLGSVLSERAIPIQAMYSASKHAVKGFTEGLRVELSHDGVPVDVVLIKPSAMNTPYLIHAKNYTGRRASFPPPVYDPYLVADAICECAQRPRTELTIGEQKSYEWMEKLSPAGSDKAVEMTAFRQQDGGEPSHRDRVDSLHEPCSEGYGEEYGDYEGATVRVSPYTTAARHPKAASGIAIAAGVIAAGVGVGLLMNRGDEE